MDLKKKISVILLLHCEVLAVSCDIDEAILSMPMTERAKTIQFVQL